MVLTLQSVYAYGKDSRFLFSVSRSVRASTSKYRKLGICKLLKVVVWKKFCTKYVFYEKIWNFAFSSMFFKFLFFLYLYNFFNVIKTCNLLLNIQKMSYQMNEKPLNSKGNGLNYRSAKIGLSSGYLANFATLRSCKIHFSRFSSGFSMLA